VQELSNPVLIRLDPHDAVIFETGHAIGEEGYGMEEVLDKDGFENVKFELAL